MFDRLTQRLGAAVQSLRGRGRLTEDNIADTLREVRMALLEADVALPVVRAFIEGVKARALGTEVLQSLSPGQALVGILHRELVSLLGGDRQGLALNERPPLVLLLAGLQGAGKTTTSAKLARWLIESQKKRVLLVSTDIRRPAAVLQLERLAQQVGADFFPVPAGKDPAAIASAALAQAQNGLYEALIVDTAGRLHVDAELMQEVQAIDAAIGAHQRLFVVDAMSGQDALQAARAFSDALELTGVILTKADGDARGGAALSVRHVTGKPIVFLGVGEKTEALEAFDPERMATRILGMGDVVALVENAQRNVDTAEAERMAKKFASGKNFDFTDLRSQLEQVRRMGGLGAIMDKLPQQMTGGKAPPVEQAEKQLKGQVAIIDSMTQRERRNPGVIDGSRRRRIAAGAGVQVQDVNRLLKQFQEMQRAMKAMKGGRMGRMLAAMKGKMPPGFPG